MDLHLVQPRSQGSLLPVLRSDRGVGRVGENPLNEVAFGPLLWNLFQRHMTLLVKDTNLFMYADDHQLYVTWSDYNIVRIFQAKKSRKVSYVTVQEYNFLLANTKTFQRLTINPRNSDSDKETEALQIEDQIITNTSQIKLLGVEIKDILYFTSHITNICIKALSKSWCSLRLRNLIACKVKLTIYKSSILPHLTYCHLVWHNCRSSDSRKIERIQERSLRAVFHSHSESYENLLVRAEPLSQLNRRLQDNAWY